MTDAIADDWETKNQSRRYPLDEDGDVEPFDLLTDMSVAIPAGESVDDIYLSKLSVKNGRIAISLKRISDDVVVAYAYGSSDDCADLQSTKGYTGSVCFGSIGSTDRVDLTLTSTQGKLAANVAYQIPESFYISELGDGTTFITGDISIRGLSDFTVEVGTIEYESEQHSSIILRPSQKLNDRILSTCQLPPEEVFAKLYNSQGLLSINNVFADESGNITLVLTGLGYTDGDGHHVNLTIDRENMCGIDPILSKKIYDEAVSCSDA